MEYNEQAVEIARAYDAERASVKRAARAEAWREMQARLRWYEDENESLESTYLGVSTGSIQLRNRSHGQDVFVPHVGDCNECRNTLQKKYTPFIYQDEHNAPVNWNIRQYDDMRSHSPSGEGSMWYVWDDEAFGQHVEYVLHQAVIAVERIVCHGSRLKPGAWNGWKVNWNNPHVANDFKYVPGFVQGWKKDGTFNWIVDYDSSLDSFLKRDWDVKPTSKQLRACGALRVESYIYSDGKEHVSYLVDRVVGSKDPINGVLPSQLFNGAPLPKWNEPRMGGIEAYDPSDREPSRLYRLKHFNQKGMCHYCGKRVRKQGKRTPKYCKPCQAKMLQISKADSKKRISNIRAQVGSVPPNGYYAKFYVTKRSSNPIQCKAERDDGVWPNQDDLKPVRVKVVSDRRPYYLQPDGCELIHVAPTPCPVCGEGHMAPHVRDRDVEEGMSVVAGNPKDIHQSIAQPVTSCSRCGYTSSMNVSGNSEPYDGPSDD